MNFTKLILGVFLLIALLFPFASRAQVAPPSRGGTGTSTVPSYGQVLVGQPNGTYAPVATSSLGITGGGGGGSSEFATTSANHWLTTKSTSNLLEGTNLYYTLARLQSALASGYSAIFGNATTTSATSTNLAVTGSFNLLGTVITNVGSWFAGLFDTNFASKSTTNLAEGANQYFTNARARSAISETVTGLDYTSGTGVLSLTSGFAVPLAASTTDWNTAYLSRITSATAPLSLAGNVLSISTAGDWTGTFDGQEGSYYLARANHTGSQLAATISDFAFAARALFSGTGGISYNSGTGAFSLNASIEDLNDVAAMTENYGDLLFWNGSAWTDVATSSLGISSGSTYTATYPVTLTGNAFGLAFGTTSSNTWAGTQTFSNTPVLGSLSGIIKGSSGTLSAAANGTDYSLITALTCSAGQFFSSATAAGIFTCSSPIGGGGSGLGTTSPWSQGQLAMVASNAAVTGVSTSTFSVSGPFTVPATLGAAVGGSNTTIGYYGLATTSPIAQSQVLYGTSASGVASVGTTTLSFTGPFRGAVAGALVGGTDSTITYTGLATTSQPTSSNLLVSNGGAGVYGVATSTLTAGSGLSGSFTQLGTGGAVSCATATGSTFGCLTAADWTTFNGKVATSRTIGTTYPLQGGGDLSANRTLSLAFGTTTSNTWAATQTFTSAPVLSSVGAGTVNATSGGTLYSTSTSTAALSSSFSYSGTLGAFVGGAGGTLSIATGGVSNAMLANGTISGVALGSNLANLTATDSTLTFSGAYNGGTARTVGVNLSNPNTWSALQTFSYASSTGFSTGYASSTVWRGGGLTTDCDNGTTSKLLWDATTGQFSCGTDQGGGGGGSGTVNVGTVGQLPYYAADGTALTATSSLFLAASGSLGLGTSSPSAQLTVSPQLASRVGLLVQGTASQSADLIQARTSAGDVGFSVDASGTINALSQIQFNSPVYTQFQATQPGVSLEFKTVAGGGDIRFTPNDTTSVYFATSGRVGIGTSSPYAKLSVVGQTVSEFFTATSTSATSTLPNLLSANLRLTGRLYDGSNSPGTTGMILQSIGSGVQWIAASVLDLLDGTPDTNLTADGPQTNTFNAGAVITAGDLVYMNTSGAWAPADADAEATASGLLAVSLQTEDSADPLLVALPGSFVRNDAWNWTPGAPLYASTTPGAMTATFPTGEDDVVRVVGYAVTADVVYFLPETPIIYDA